MTDLEITKLCAEALGYSNMWEEDDKLKVYVDAGLVEFGELYDPLYDDAQALALVKKCALALERTANKGKTWMVRSDWKVGHAVICDDLNRAICECVAKMQQAKGT